MPSSEPSADPSTDAVQDAPASRLSRMAAASAVLGLGAVACNLLAGLPAVVLGVAALRKIHQSDGALHGEAWAKFGLWTGGGFTLIGGVLLFAAPALLSAREAARRDGSARRMAEQYQAVLKFDEEHGALPSDGRLSRRARLLPWLQETAVYDRLSLDEPFDSKTNALLAAPTPTPWRIPGSPSAALGGVGYLAPVGKGTAFDPQKTWSLAQVQEADGLSFTALWFESNESSVVQPWHRPADLPFTPDAPLQGLGSRWAGGFQMVLFDGHVRFISRSISPAVFTQLVLPDDAPTP